MKFLLDENIPSRLARVLKDLGHDVERASPQTPDITIAESARIQERILITLDNDFNNTALFSPQRFDIILIKIHPPYKDHVCAAVLELLKECSTSKLKGLMILTIEGSIRIGD